MKFIGHLDVMRYFQKAIRRADLPVAYSEGFRPHMLLSFASPLGVGKTSHAEYFDLELDEKAVIRPQEIWEALNREMAEGIAVVRTGFVADDKSTKGMSQVQAALYTARFRKGKVKEPEDIEEAAQRFFSQDSIEILRKTKRSERVTDIRPWILEFTARREQNTPRVSQEISSPKGNMQEEEKEASAQPLKPTVGSADNSFAIYEMKLAAGSVHNLKPELLMEAFARFCGFEIPPFSLRIQREEIYGRGEEGNLIPLDGYMKDSYSFKEQTGYKISTFSGGI